MQVIIIIAGLFICSNIGKSQESVNVSTKTLTVEQVWRPVSFRDPFSVSTVYGDETKNLKPKTSSTNVTDVQKSSFSIYNLTLTGVMEDRKGKQALLTDEQTGSVYILKSGKLFDSKKKEVKGVAGVVRGKQVILMTEDKKVLPLKLYDKE